MGKGAVMKKTLIFVETISSKTVTEIIEKIESVIETNEINLYFSSNGGSCFFASILSDVLNRYSEKITLILKEEVSSSAFDLLLDTKCKLEIHYPAYSIVHNRSMMIDCGKISNKNGENNYYYKREKELNLMSLMEYSRFLTKSEMNDIKRGLDICLDSARLMIILKDKCL